MKSSKKIKLIAIASALLMLTSAFSAAAVEGDEPAGEPAIVDVQNEAVSSEEVAPETSEESAPATSEADIAETSEEAAPATSETKPAKTTKKPKKAKVGVSKATCTSAGKVNLSLKGSAKYDKTVTAIIKDSDGKEWSAKVIKKTKKLAVISGEGLVEGQKYTVTISGIKTKDDEDFGTATACFKAKKISTKVKAEKITKKIKVKKSTTITVKCNSSLQLKDAVVKVKNNKGKSFNAKVLGKGKGTIKIKINGLKKKSAYSVTITGVKSAKEKNYGTVTSSFKTK